VIRNGQELRTPAKRQVCQDPDMDSVGNSELGGLFLFTLTLINAGLAQGKGRSGLAWWLLSLVLGPIATLLIVVLPRPKPSGTN
jgi:hypothetical protein